MYRLINTFKARLFKEKTTEPFFSPKTEKAKKRFPTRYSPDCRYPLPFPLKTRRTHKTPIVLKKKKKKGGGARQRREEELDAAYDLAQKSRLV